MNMQEIMERLDPRKPFRKFLSKWRLFDRFISPDQDWMDPVHRGESTMENLDNQKYQLADLEKLLASTMKPVKPRPGFVRELRQRLMDPSIPSVVENKTPPSHYALLVTASILSGAFLVVAGSRAVVTFLGTVGVLSYLKTRVDEKGLTPAPKQAI